jgi:peptidoglycan hydrolase CwlO-like protein
MQNEEAASSTMLDKETKKRLKQIEKEISQLKKQIRKLEFRPCRSDAELNQKEEDTKALQEKISLLEKEHDSHILKTGKIKHSI